MFHHTKLRLVCELETNADRHAHAQAHSEHDHISLLKLETGVTNRTVWAEKI